MSKSERISSVSLREKSGIYIVLLLILIGLGFSLWSGLKRSFENYARGIVYAEKASGSVSVTDPAFRPDVSMLYILQYSRAMTADATKSSALYLGFVVVLVGCLFVLYGVEAFYSLKVQQKEIKSALETSSPGLVLITLGIVVIVVTLATKAEFTTDVTWANAAARTGDFLQQATESGEPSLEGRIESRKQELKKIEFP